MTDETEPLAPTAEAICQLVKDMDRARRSGWARVAQLEEIIDAYRDLLAYLEIHVRWPEGPGGETIEQLLWRCVDLDPPERERWPPKITPTYRRRKSSE